MTGFRLPNGRLIDRNKPLSFSFDGKTYRGFAGDTLASALIANGVMFMGRSFKYHRPRGPLTAGSAEPNALVEVGTGARREPNVRATTLELANGLVTRSQNRWPSLCFDVSAVNQIVAPFLVAGFYYKTFMWPKSFWEKLYEPVIRMAAGLGTATHKPDPDRYEKTNAHCDVLVIGGGPAGLSAALAAARAGARVLIADENPQPGGALLFDDDIINAAPAHDWAAQTIADLVGRDNVRFLPRTTVFGRYDGNSFGALERVQKHLSEPDAAKPVERLWRIYAKQTILASGAQERPLVFGGNDRPGVMQASAVRQYVNHYRVSPGRRAVIFTNNSSGYQTASCLIKNGIEVAAIIDSRKSADTERSSDDKVFQNSVVTNVKGYKSVRGVEVFCNGTVQTIDCDFVAMSGGWNPNVHLACHHGEKPDWNEAIAAFVAPDTPVNMVTIGAAAGDFSLQACLQAGASKGARAAKAAGFRSKSVKALEVSEGPRFSIEPLWNVDQSTGKAFIDFQNDVTSKDVPLAAREGYKDVEMAKRYTTLGMATDQGKLSNVNAIGILAGETAKTIPQVGTTTYRPFYTPVSFGALAGAETRKNFAPTRYPPTHKWAMEQGAVMLENGLWMRPGWFPHKGDRDGFDAMKREVINTRKNVGVCDVSTLGKIDLQGPDAAEFMNRIYCNGWKTLPVGKARYGVMLREDGIVFDDGTASRLAENHFVITTTTANAGPVMAHMEFCHQVLWPELDIQFFSITDQWAQIAVAGPKSRQTLQKIITQDLSNEAFAFMAARPVTIAGGVRGRLFRISFSGELAYELAVPADYGDSLIRTIMAAGEEFSILPYGIEALTAMRIEKGHAAGGELNGTVTAYDLGLGKLMSTKKDYIGCALAKREAFHRTDRWRLVGLLPEDKQEKIHGGAHILNVGDSPSMQNDQGYITSATFSPMLDQWIALGLVNAGGQRHGQTVEIWDALRDSFVKATICDPVFYDREHVKLHA
jgi:sarcosine oxidase subunit alpha